MPAPVVFLAAGAPVPVAVKENWSAALSRPDAAMAACRLMVGALPALVNTQVICAAGKIFAAFTVMEVPATVPKLPTLPVTAELASVQLAVVKVKVEVTVSVICTALLRAVTLLATGAAGAAVPTVVVVMDAGVVARLVTAKLNGPPSPPVVIFCTATDAGFAALVKTQLIWLAEITLVEGMLSTLPTSVPKLAGLPVLAPLTSLHIAEVGVKLPLAVSVN